MSGSRRGRIAIRGLGVSFGGRSILRGVDLDVKPGSFVCVLGRSGCGKSTLLDVLAGFLAPTSGEVAADERPVRGPGPDRSMVFQADALFPWKTALENVAFGPLMTGAPRAEATRLAREYLQLVGLEEHADARPSTLSGGMKQRVAIARALVTRPGILLMDEPFGALDAQTRLGMQSVLLDAWKRDRPTVVFVTHDIEEAIFLSDRIVILGGTPAAVRDGHDVPFPRPRREELRFDPDFTELRRRSFEALSFSNG